MAAVRREDVDYVPCCAVFNPLHATLRRGYTWNFPWPEDAPLEERLSYQVQELGLDQVIHVNADLCRPLPEVESDVWLDGDVLHKRFRTPAGELHASIRYNDAWPFGLDIPLSDDFNVGHFLEPWIKTEADLECLKCVFRVSDTKEVLSEVRQGIAERRNWPAGSVWQLSATSGRGSREHRPCSE